MISTSNENRKLLHNKDKSGKETSTFGLLSFANQKIIYPLRFTVFFLMRLLYHFLYKYEILDRPPPPITITSLSDKYINTQRTRFLASYETGKYSGCASKEIQSTSIERSSSEVINTNIEKCFYDVKEYALEMEEADNELEQTWRRRLMFENTPRGNIIMHYDAYKRGFVYYSDNSSIPYFVINAAIMKYVLLYRCRDFFIDTQFIPETNPSPLCITDKPDSSKTASEVNTKKPHSIKSSSFIKLKSYNTLSTKLDSTNSSTPISNTSQSDEEKKHTRNKVIYSGKIANFNFLRPSKVVKPTPFSSELLDGLKSNSNAQSQVFSYKDFKRLKEKQMTKE